MPVASKTLAKRVTTLERQLRTIKSQFKTAKNASGKPWWVDLAGRFKDDALFDEIAAAGQAYRRARNRRAR